MGWRLSGLSWMLRNSTGFPFTNCRAMAPSLLLCAFPSTACLQVACQTPRWETCVTVVDLQFVARASGIALRVGTQNDAAFTFGVKAKIAMQDEISEDGICPQITAIARICCNRVVYNPPLAATPARPAKKRFPVE